MLRATFAAPPKSQVRPAAKSPKLPERNTMANVGSYVRCGRACVCRSERRIPGRGGKRQRRWGSLGVAVLPSARASPQFHFAGYCAAARLMMVIVVAREVASAQDTAVQFGCAGFLNAPAFLPGVPNAHATVEGVRVLRPAIEVPRDADCTAAWCPRRAALGVGRATGGGEGDRGGGAAKQGFAGGRAGAGVGRVGPAPAQRPAGVCFPPRATAAPLVGKGCWSAAARWRGVGLN